MLIELHFKDLAVSKYHLCVICVGLGGDFDDLTVKSNQCKQEINISCFTRTNHMHSIAQASKV